MDKINNLKPTSIKQRISSIDIVRGFALLGIILVNALGFNASFFNFGGFYGSLPDTFQSNFYKIYISLSSDKFIFLFSFLFGYGIYLQFNKFKANNNSFVSFFSRRMLVLLMFGIAHVLFLWAGDILICYSIAGFILILLHKLPAKLLIPISLVFYFFIGIWLTFSVWFPLPDALTSTCVTCLDKAKIVYSSGNYFECLKLRLLEYYSFRNINAFYYLPKIIGITLFGFIAAKNNFHKHVADNKLKWTYVLIGISIIGTISYFGYEKIVDFNSPYANAVYMSGYEFMNIFIASSYLLLVLILASIDSIARFFSPIALMGRMSLTNYISQSLILAIVFYGWGMGRFGQTSVTTVVFLAIGIYVLQIMLNSIWFRYFNQGPLEKLWRKFSYNHS